MKKMLMSAVGVAAFAAAFAAEETCKDGICPLPASPAEAEFAVLSPVPETAVETVKQGPRLKSLEGKTIALVGGSFMASVTHSELKNLILKEFPTAKVYLLNEIGSAGVYPHPGVVRREKDEFQRRYPVPDIPGSGLKSRLVSYFDESLVLSRIKDAEGKEHLCFQTTEPAGLAKDRSGKLAPVEEPNILKIKNKIISK